MKRNMVLIIAIVLIATTAYSCFKNINNKEVLENKYIQTIDYNTLSLMYETNAGSGEYILSDDLTWPDNRYTFNGAKSKCENNSELIWNEEDKIILVETNSSDRCYVYFDKKETLANYIKATAETDPTLILHNGSISDDTYGITDAEDNNYRYSGSSDEVKNFVCFGSDATTCPNDNLYRIIGVFNETNIDTREQEVRVKLIKYDYVLTNLLGTDGEYKGGYQAIGHDVSYYRGPTEIATIPGYYFNTANGNSSTNDWTISKLNTVNLNTNYAKNIGEKWADKIAETTWKIGGMTWIQGSESPNIAKNAYTYELGINSIDKTYQAKIGLIYMSDYYYAAAPTYWIYYGWDSNDGPSKDYRAAIENNWMYMGLGDWSISPCSDDSALEFYVYMGGSGNLHTVSYIAFGVRPSFYLKSSIVLSGGSGTKLDPYRIV